MTNQKTVICVFCQGTGKNPHFTGTCPVCKGKGKNTVVGPFAACKDCRGSGQKRGTTLTCFTCSGLGVVPDMRPVIKKAREEIKKAQEEMEEERRELREKTCSTPSERPSKKLVKRWTGQIEEEETVGKLFCQCCGHKVEKSSTIKVCLKCFQKIKKVEAI